MSVTNQTKVEGPLARVVHVDESGTDPVYTYLAKTPRDELGDLDLGEDSEDVNLSTTRRTDRTRTHNSPELELATLLQPDDENLELLGLVDEASADGEISFANEDRRLGPDTYIHIEFLAEEWLDNPGGATVEKTLRFGDVEMFGGSVNLSDTPPSASATMWIHGMIALDY